MDQVWGHCKRASTALYDRLERDQELFEEEAVLASRDSSAMTGSANENAKGNAAEYPALVKDAKMWAGWANRLLHSRTYQLFYMTLTVLSLLALLLLMVHRRYLCIRLMLVG